MKTGYFIGITLILLLCLDCSKQVIVPEDIEQEIINEIHTKGIPSVAICIVEDNQIAWEWVYGYANTGDLVPATRLTLYHFMSISKLLIATSVMQLVEEGKLELDHDINNYLSWSVRNPRFPELSITARMLMNHTSGIAHPNRESWEGEIYRLYPWDEMPRISEWLPEYLLPGGSSFHPDVWKDFKPGEGELYSNIATSLLALVVEEVSGEEYTEYCREHIFKPLQMHRTGFLYSQIDTNLLALPYITMSSHYPLYNFMHYPGANLKSNLEDFSHFMIAMIHSGEYMGKRILETSSVDQLFDLNNPATGMGLLWTHCPGDCIGHSGGGEGFSSRFELYPERNKAMLVLTNRRNNSVYPQDRIYDLVRLKVNEM
jgi:CubicO group peptidase (beta-lactamase class C family)